MIGVDDQVVPVKGSAKKSAWLIRGAKEIYYPGGRTDSRPRTRNRSTPICWPSSGASPRQARRDLSIPVIDGG